VLVVHAVNLSNGSIVELVLAHLICEAFKQGRLELEGLSFLLVLSDLFFMCKLIQDNNYH
jgi:hypothetical protein